MNYTKLVPFLAVLTAGLLAVACNTQPQMPAAKIEIPDVPVYSSTTAGGAVAAPNGVKMSPVMSAPNILTTSPAAGSWSSDVGKVVKIPYRRFLLPLKMPTVLKDGETKSFVVFTHRPTTDAELVIYKHVCRQWVADFETYESALTASAVVPNAKLMPFYWPTTTNTVTALGCNDLYDYDYAFATAIVALVGVQAQSDGPLLVLQQGKEWMLLDISKFEPVDVQRAFVIWKRQIVLANPLSTKFSLVKFREYFRTLVNQYGESIAKYAKVG